MSWTIPVATMCRLDDSTARLLAGTFHAPERAEREPMPADSASMVLSPEQWRARNLEVAA